jgi:uncharacterized membrane protein YkvA (DUF1232 family)
MFQSLRERARRLQAETYAVYLASRDPRTPILAKALAATAVGYALSPIDLIPDFIPVLGYLDDLVIVPLLLALAIRLIPAEVLAESREKARVSMMKDASKHRLAAAIVVLIWVGLAALCVWIVVRML